MHHRQGSFGYNDGNASRRGEPSSPRSITENNLAQSVTGISRQLLETFAFSQVDQLVGDVAHMRGYLVEKFPTPTQRPLGSVKPNRPTSEEQIVLAEYKGAIYGQQCLASQQVILEYLLGKCLEQCRACLEELRNTQDASRMAEESIDYVLQYGRSRRIAVDVDGVNAESTQMFRQVRRDLYELGEEMRDLEGARDLTAQFLSNPGSVLPLSRDPVRT